MTLGIFFLSSRVTGTSCPGWTALSTSSGTWCLLAPLLEIFTAGHGIDLGTLQGECTVCCASGIRSLASRIPREILNNDTLRPEYCMAITGEIPVALEPGMEAGTLLEYLSVQS